MEDERLKLYELNFRHYSQKDSKEGIICYLVAETDEQIYEFLKTEPTIPDGTEYGRGIYNDWQYKDDLEDESYDENHRHRLIECCGEMYDDEAEICDLYYGLTHYGWNCVCEDFRETEIDILKSYGITVVNCNINTNA